VGRRSGGGIVTRPRVLLDCDGVLSDFIGSVLALTNELLGTSYRPEDVTEFDFMRALGLPPDTAAAVKRRIGTAPGFAAALAVYPGAVDGVAKLGKHAEIYVVTSPWNSNPTWCHDREAWLERNFGVPHNRVIHTSAKRLIAGDVLVDDKTATCDAWRAAWPRGIAVRWETLHNHRDAWTGPSMASWVELLEVVRSLGASRSLAEHNLVAAGRAER
jgi:5'(3')-deoxyribonucleotidase